jgi:hypothetical protein
LLHFPNRNRSKEAGVNAYTMLWTAIVLFALAAADGLVLAGVRVFGERNPPASLALPASV